MASEDENSSENRAVVSRYRPVNLQLMRLVLRSPGSPLWAVEDGRLYEAFQKLGLPHDLCVELWLRGREGRLTKVSKNVIYWARISHFRRQKKERLSPLAGDERHGDASADLQLMVLEVAETFCATLAADKQGVFDAWIASGCVQGWQRQYARQIGRVDSWVSARVTRIRQRLATEHGIENVNAFMKALAHLEQSDPEEPDDLPESMETLTITTEEDHDRFAEVRQRLWDGCAEGSRERQYMTDMAGALTAEEITTRYPDEEAILAWLHDRYWRCAHELRSSGRPNNAQPRPTDDVGGDNP